MPQKQALKGVASDQVGEVVQQFVRDDAHEVVASQNVDGSWDVTASF